MRRGTSRFSGQCDYLQLFFCVTASLLKMSAHPLVPLSSSKAPQGKILSKSRQIMAKWKVKVSHGLDNQQHEVLAIEAVHAPSPLDGDRLDSLSVEQLLPVATEGFRYFSTTWRMETSTNLLLRSLMSAFLRHPWTHSHDLLHTQWNGNFDDLPTNLTEILLVARGSDASARGAGTRRRASLHTFLPIT